MSDSTVEFCIRNVSAELKAELVADAESADANVNDVAVGILASFFSVEFTPSGRKSYPGRAGGQIVIELPFRLHKRLRDAAARTPTRPGTTMERVALRILNTHYGLPYAPPPPARRGRRRSNPAEAVA